MSNKKVIVIDSNVNEANLITEAFNKLEMVIDIDHFTNKVDFFEYLSNGESLDNIAIILLDLKLPQEEGTLILQELHQQIHYSRLPILVFTTSPSPDIIESCYNLGANAVLNKPSDPDAMFQSIKTISQFWLDINVLPISTLSNQLHQY